MNQTYQQFVAENEETLEHLFVYHVKGINKNITFEAFCRFAYAHSN